MEATRATRGLVWNYPLSKYCSILVFLGSHENQFSKTTPWSKLLPFGSSKGFPTKKLAPILTRLAPHNPNGGRCDGGGGHLSTVRSFGRPPWHPFCWSGVLWCAYHGLMGHQGHKLKGHFSHLANSHLPLPHGLAPSETMVSDHGLDPPPSTVNPMQ